MSVVDRGEFERWRYCARCGRRLRYAQVQLQGALVQRLTKACPMFASDSVIASVHDFLEHEHEYPARTRRGVLTRGSKRVRVELLSE